MNNTEFTANILKEINNQIDKLTPAFLIDGAELTTRDEINERFGSFADFKIFAKQMIAGDTVQSTPVATAEEDANTTNESEEQENTTQDTTQNTDTNPLDGVSTNTQTQKKTVIVTDHAGKTKKITCPEAANLKQILGAVGVNTEEGFEVRVNGEKQEDVFSIPEDGSIITALRDIKGNL